MGDPGIRAENADLLLRTKLVTRKRDNTHGNATAYLRGLQLPEQTHFGNNNMLRNSLFVLLVASILAACSKAPENADKAASVAAAKPLLISPEDLLTVRNNALASGPSITGSVQPERRADLRAEVSAVVLQVLKENGDNVRRGDLLVRLDDTSIRDGLSSAEAATRSADQAFVQAERQFQRMTTLRGSGMVSTQALDDAETRRNNAQSDLAGAKARSVQARQQLQRTEARAPFDGIVSDRKVSAGDTAQIGKELLKVIDPSSMRFEGMVSADNIGDVKAGQPVGFRVNGYGEQEFSGKVRRVNPSANATTRQVEVLVDFAGATHPGVAGLYAEGRVQSQTVSALMLSESLIQREGDQAFAWAIKDGKLSKIALKLGERDDRLGEYRVTAGLKAGDQVLRHPTNGLQEGRKVELSKPAVSAVSAAVSAPASVASK